MNARRTVRDMGTLHGHVRCYVGGRVARRDIQPDTARTIRNHLNQFADYWGKRPLDQLSAKAMERWIERMTAAGLAPSTQNTRLSSVRTFARWCVLEGIVVRDWTLAAPKVRRPRATARDVNNADFHRVLACARTTREQVIVWLMFDVGLRCVSVSRLNVDDFEPDRAQIFVTDKGGGTRYAQLTPRVVDLVERYLAESGHHSGPLIRTEDERSARLGKERISGLVGRMFRESGVKRRPYDGRSAHGLRAAGATDFYEQCQDPRLTAEWLGHVGMQNLGPYVARAHRSEVRRVQMQRSHVADLSPPVLRAA